MKPQGHIYAETSSARELSSPLLVFIVVTLVLGLFLAGQLHLLHRGRGAGGREGGRHGDRGRRRQHLELGMDGRKHANVRTTNICSAKIKM